jgi:hypothetical protein
MMEGWGRDIGEGIGTSKIATELVEKITVVVVAQGTVPKEGMV